MPRAARALTGALRGSSRAGMVLLDYGDVVVHVFLEEIRGFYEIERLYGDVDTLDWS